MLERTEIQTKHGRRTLPLGTPDLDALQAHRDRQVFDRKRNKGWQGQSLICCTVYGGPLDNARVYDFWTSAGQAHRDQGPAIREIGALQMVLPEQIRSSALGEAI